MTNMGIDNFFQGNQYMKVFLIRNNCSKINLENIIIKVLNRML